MNHLQELGGTKKHYNHNKTQKNKPKVLLIGKIYADWCGHCRMLKPEWNKLKYNIKHKNGSHGYQIHYIEIEQQNEQSKVDKVNKIYLHNTDKKLSLQGGYPTIFKIINGNIEYYSGDRKAEAMQKWFLHHGGNHDTNMVTEEKIGGDEPKKEQSLWNLKLFGGKTRNKRKLKRYPKNKSAKRKATYFMNFFQ
jgi:thiol-disulfide isomerase/thioredoxin